MAGQAAQLPFIECNFEPPLCCAVRSFCDAQARAPLAAFLAARLVVLLDGLRVLPCRLLLSSVSSSFVLSGLVRSSACVFLVFLACLLTVFCRYCLLLSLLLLL